MLPVFSSKCSSMFFTKVCIIKVLCLNELKKTLAMAGRVSTNVLKLVSHFMKMSEQIKKIRQFISSYVNIIDSEKFYEYICLNLQTLDNSVKMFEGQMLWLDFPYHYDV